MKLVSKAALGLAIAVMTSAPALAQRKAKAPPAAAPTGPQLKLSKGFRAAALPVDTAYKASDWNGVLTAANAAEATAITPDDKYQLNQYRLQAGAKLNNVQVQTQALDQLLATGLVPAADAGKFNYFAGKFAYDRNDYARALSYLQAAETGGYATTDVYLLRSRIYSGQKQSVQSLAELDKAIAAERAAGRAVPEDWYKFGYGEAYRGKLNNEFAKWTMMHVRAFPTPENWRSALVLYRDGAKLGSKTELDLYRLMRASRSLAGEKDHYDYAYIADQAGLPGEAKTVLDGWKATGGANSAPINELSKAIAGKAASDRAGLAAEEKRALAGTSGTLAANTANAYLGYGEYAKAATLFQAALTKGGVDADETNTRLGIALAMQGQKDAAKAAFAQVRGTRAGVAQYWSAWLDRSA